MIKNNILKVITYILDKIIPKKKRIVFSSFPDLSDNAFALFSFMVSDKRLIEYSFIWLLQKETKKYPELQNRANILFVKKNSVRGFYLYLSSIVVFYTHGLYKNIVSFNNKKRINLWHGMPFKKVGILEDNFMGAIPSQDKLIVTSQKCAQIYAKPFNILEKNILPLGQSRNDFLKKETFFFKNKGIDLSQYKKIISWLPTYKKSNFDSRIDGVFDENKIGFLKRAELKILNSYLLDKKILLILKLHPMDALNKEVFDSLKNILIIRNKDLEDCQEQLYPILGLSDALITDFSSVFIDYLLLDKPIAFDLADFESYNKSRGFLFDDPKKLLIGNHLYNYNDLIVFLNNIYEEIDEYREERILVKNMFHKNCDFDSSRRITDWMLNELI
ncbi:CDP-glycerol glycerophosphotransferase family protein [Polaribacter sp. HL-MS24]|uniref:CDP-glycerol glycerophosphotransferase family protein n=1 Tax=Polaribacter sp. HL-MS24 TaxID=3077735 RepID=UPI002934514A|nr:CDP-glycerol glycerophosphotransferase family protein [Polaribacter sp. HL-MS24]WOC39238.1 CDP-glycerol glycerophosphotransferase family protein [Polaribacter sp. HL-MS24]